MKLFLLLLLLFSTQLWAEGEAPSPALWAEKILLKGDLRLRHEYLSPGDTGANSRNRQRVRGRVALEAKPADEWTGVFALATGSDTNPVSTNQSLGDGWSKKGIYLDQVAIYYKILPGFETLLGKMKNPYYRALGWEIIWDADVNPEGFAFNYKDSFDGIEVQGLLPVYWIKEEGGKGKDRVLYGIQSSVKSPIIDPVWTRVTLGYLSYTNMKYGSVIDYSGKNKSYGNTLDASNLYVNQYNILDSSLEVGATMASIPLSLGFHFINNFGASEENKAWLLGLEAGKIKNAGSWSARYNYRSVETDAVVAAFADSDFNGGVTGASGHKISLEYGVADPASIGLTYFRCTDMGEKTTNTAQFDLVMKF